MLGNHGIKVFVPDETVLLHEVHEDERGNHLGKHQSVAKVELVHREHSLVEECDADRDCPC